MTGANMLQELQDIRRASAPECGTKAACLGELTSLGYLVPPGLVVSTRAYESFLRGSSLHDVARALSEESLTASPARLVAIQDEIARAFAGAALDAGLVAQIRRWMDRFDAGVFAVRSSATNEDLPGASFAGQYDSFLNVDPARVPQAVIGCFASLFNARAALYRRRKNMPGMGAMAVLVQPMVASDHGGVVFTRAPRRDHAMLIECAPGGNDGVVGGRATPNRYYLDRATLRVEESSERHAIDWACVRAAADQALAIEAVFARAQDVEYAVARNTIHILQARPAKAS